MAYAISKLILKSVLKFIFSIVIGNETLFTEGEKHKDIFRFFAMILLV